MEIIFSSHNHNKIKEIKKLLTNTNIKIISLFDLDEYEKVEETGSSFSENAELKATYYYDKYHKPVIADDSGLVIPNFNNKPGIYSARYAGEDANDLDNNLKLLDDIKNLKNRKAYFNCTICYINKTTYFFTGMLMGQIASDIKGTEGFGYDPIFILEDGRRLSELKLEEKNNISHRSQAFKKWLEFIKDGGKNE